MGNCDRMVDFTYRLQNLKKGTHVLVCLLYSFAASGQPRFRSLSLISD